MIENLARANPILIDIFNTQSTHFFYTLLFFFENTLLALKGLRFEALGYPLWFFVMVLSRERGYGFSLNPY
jgi:hypothetical protein